MTDQPASTGDLIEAPNANDVLLGRGTGASDFVGNIAYRCLVENRKAEYCACGKNKAKNEIAGEVYDQVRSSGGRFLRKVKGEEAKPVKGSEEEEKPVFYYEVEESVALEKIKQSLREKKIDRVVHSLETKEEEDIEQDLLGGMASQSASLAANSDVTDGTPFSTPLIAACASTRSSLSESAAACLGGPQGVPAGWPVSLSSTTKSTVDVHSPSGSRGVGAASTQPSNLTPLLPSSLLGTAMGSRRMNDSLMLLWDDPRWVFQQQMMMQQHHQGSNDFQSPPAARIDPPVFDAGLQQGGMGAGLLQNQLREGTKRRPFMDGSMSCTIFQDSPALSAESATLYHRPGINTSCPESVNGVSPRGSPQNGSHEATGTSSMSKSEEDSVKLGNEESVSSSSPVARRVSSSTADTAAASEEDNTRDVVQFSDDDDDDASEFFLSLLEESNRPKFTEQHERLERASLTDAERSSALVDMFGRMCTIQPNKRANRDLDEESIRFLIQQMRLEMDRIPSEKKLALLEAQSKCDAGEFSNARLERFLRCEGMNTELGAQRFVNYWECRRDLFGPEKYLLPMTLSGALRDDLVAIETGLFRLLPSLDCSGRQLLVVEVHRHTREGYTSVSMLRAMWYVIEVIAQENTHIRSGFINLVWEKDSTIWDYDYILHDRVPYFERTCWPVRSICSHICSPPWFVLQFVKPILIHLLDKHLRSRTVIHDGEGDALLEDLASYGILEEMLPTDMGGTVEFCQSEWIANRRSTELEEI